MQHAIIADFDVRSNDAIRPDPDVGSERGKRRDDGGGVDHAPIRPEIGENDEAFFIGATISRRWPSFGQSIVLVSGKGDSRCGTGVPLSTRGSSFTSPGSVKDLCGLRRSMP